MGLGATLFLNEMRRRDAETQRKHAEDLMSQQQQAAALNTETQRGIAERAAHEAQAAAEARLIAKNKAAADMMGAEQDFKHRENLNALAEQMKRAALQQRESNFRAAMADQRARELAEGRNKILSARNSILAAGQNMRNKALAEKQAHQPLADFSKFVMADLNASGQSMRPSELQAARQRGAMALETINGSAPIEEKLQKLHALYGNVAAPSGDDEEDISPDDL